MKANLLESALRKLIADHHDAFAVELLGATGAGLSVERVQELVTSNFIDPAKLAGWMIPGLRNDINPYLFVRFVSQVIDATSPEDQYKLRDWSIGDWQESVDYEADNSWVQAGLPIGGSVTVGKPTPPQQPLTFGIATIDDAPAWMGESEKQAYLQARSRAGEYARGLGTLMGEDLGQIVYETWDGEDIVTEADAELRQERLEQVREVVGDALATHSDPDRLAVELMEKTDDWEHNWERIARTEIQAAYNEGRVIDAIGAYGQETLIARVTEAGACETCLALLKNSDGTPIVFPLEELLANGVNVGKPRSAWLASVYPIHPNCRCDTIVVPPGFVVDINGRLKRQINEKD